MSVVTALALAQAPAPVAGAPVSVTVALLALAFAASVASGVAAAWLTARAADREQWRDVVRTDIDRVMEAVAPVRDAYRRRSRGAPVDAFELAHLEDQLELAAARTTKPIIEAARTYLLVGRAYAAGDPDSGDSAEETAYEELKAALVAERNAWN